MALKHFHHQSILTKPTTILAAIVVVIIIYFLFLQGPSAQQLSSNKNLTLSVNSSYNFNLPDDSNITSIFLASSSSTEALIYLSKVPVLEKSLYVIPLGKGVAINISVHGATYADLQIKFVSGTSTSAQLVLAPIPKNLNIPASNLNLLNSTSFGQTTATTTVPITTQQTTQGTSSTTVVTTVNSANATQQVLIDANSSSVGTLMVNYNKLYIKAATQCTSSVYNSTYITDHSQAPNGPNTFENVTQAVPTSMSSSVTKISPTLYNVTYTAVIPIGNLKSLQMQINTTTKFVTTYTFEGIFQDLSSTSVLQQYQALNQSGNPCSPYVV